MAGVVLVVLLMAVVVVDTELLFAVPGAAAHSRVVSRPRS